MQQPSAQLRHQSHSPSASSGGQNHSQRRSYRPRQTHQPTTAKERRKSLQRTRPIRTGSDPDEIQVEVEMVQSRPGDHRGHVVPLQITSDADDTLNAWRVPSLEKDEEYAATAAASKRPRPGEAEDDAEEDPAKAETEPLLIHDDDLDSVVIEMAQHER